MATDNQRSSQRDGAAATRVGVARGFSALPTGARLDRYVVESVIAAGGFGITYIARHEALGRIVAIKEHFPRQFAFRDGATSEVRPTDPSTYSWALDRFLQEGRSLGLCKHGNVVDVTDVFEANGTAYMVLGYEDGVSMKTWRDQLGRQPTQAEVDTWLGPLLDALAFIHEAGLLHRDLAPDNIMIRRDGTPCLIDFGAARQALAERSQMMSAIVKGGFSPPEQYTSSGRSQGPWSDIYALGATLYRTLAGKTPPEATERQLEDELAPLATVLSEAHDFRPGLLAGIDKALRLRMAERPQSVDALRRLLMSDAAPAEAVPSGAAMQPPSSDVDGARPETAAEPTASGQPIPFSKLPRADAHAKPATDPRRIVPLLVASSIALMIGGVAAWSLLRPDGGPATTPIAPVASGSPPSPQAPLPQRAPSPRLGASQAAGPASPATNGSAPTPPPVSPPGTNAQLPSQPPPTPAPAPPPAPSSPPAAAAAAPLAATPPSQQASPAAPSVLPVELASLLSDRDLDRIDNFATTRATALQAASVHADRDDDQREGQTALAQVLKGGSVAIGDGDLAGNWRCRSVQVGDRGVFAYNYFRCQITRSGDAFLFHKTSGSQRKIGRLLRLDGNRFFYFGQSYIDGDRVPVGYNGHHDNDEVGMLVKPAQGRLRLEIAERRSGVEFIELVK